MLQHIRFCEIRGYCSLEIFGIMIHYWDGIPFMYMKNNQTIYCENDFRYLIAGARTRRNGRVTELMKNHGWVDGQELSREMFDHQLTTVLNHAHDQIFSE